MNRVKYFICICLFNLKKVIVLKTITLKWKYSHLPPVFLIENWRYKEVKVIAQVIQLMRDIVRIQTQISLNLESGTPTSRLPVKKKNTWICFFHDTTNLFSYFWCTYSLGYVILKTFWSSSWIWLHMNKI